MRNKKTTEQFKKEVYELVKDKYSVLGEYIGVYTHINIKHNECGHIYSVTPHNFLNQGRRCPKCARNWKKTTNEFKEEVFQLVGDEYTVLGEYIKSNTKIEIKHNTCGHIYNVTPFNFLNRGSRCPKCSRRIKKTTEQFKEEVFQLVGNAYTVLGEYIDSNSEIEIKHNTCGHIYNVRANNFLNQGNRCPKCSRFRKKTTEQFKEEVFGLVGDEYTVLGEYIDLNSKIKIKHNTCGHIYNVRANNFLNQGNRCPKCYKKIISEEVKKNTEQFKKNVYNKVKDRYEVLGEYININIPIEVRHNICGNEYLVRPYDLLRGKKCPKCFGKKKKTTEEFKEEVYKLVGDEYSVLSEYVSSTMPIKIQHNTCGNIYKVSPTIFLNGKLCTKCSKKCRK